MTTQDAQQATLAELQRMTPEEVVSAHQEGRLNSLLDPSGETARREAIARADHAAGGGNPDAQPPAAAAAVVSAADLRDMSVEQIIAAQQSGRLNALLGYRPAQGNPYTLGQS